MRCNTNRNFETTTDEKYKNRYRISSARANWHDYDGGFYHVTICTKDRELYFGKIEDGEIKMTEIGKYAEEQFRNVTSFYPYSEIPLFVVMPNHIHAIVIIDNRDTCRDAIHRVSNHVSHRVSDFHLVKDDTIGLEAEDSEIHKGGITRGSNPMSSFGYRHSWFKGACIALCARTGY